MLRRLQVIRALLAFRVLLYHCVYCLAFAFQLYAQTFLMGVLFVFMVLQGLVFGDIGFIGFIGFSLVLLSF